jgi:SAM-dependent methyltransferase
LEASWYQREPTLSLSLISKCELGRDAAIIDVGGGASVLVDRLLAEGYCHAAVLDISANSLVFAKKRMGDRAADIEWFVDDIANFSSPHPFSLWHDRAVFHFLIEPEDRKKYVEVLKKTLRPGGYLVLAAFAIGGPTKCSGLDIVQYDTNKLLRELGEGFQLIEEVAESHTTPSNKTQQFVYFRFMRH